MQLPMHANDTQAGHHPPNADHSGGHGHRAHHARMIADFRRRFLVSLALTVPILALSPLLQSFAGLEQTLAFPGDRYLLFVLSTARRSLTFPPEWLGR